MLEWGRMKDALAKFTEGFRAAFPEAGVFLVGGCVRDELLGRAAKDVDLVVTGVGAEALEKFLADRGEVRLVGKRFGVFKSRSKDGFEADVALPRTESPAGTGGYRDVETQSDPKLSIEDDLARRDFTVNAMAKDLHGDGLVDPFDGEDDLKAKRLRAVGDPRVRFSEDRSRMLRTLRFSAQLGFDIEEGTWGALRDGMPRVNDLRPDGERVVPYEAVAREFLKGFEADALRTAELWETSGAFDALMPELGTGVAAKFEKGLAMLEKEDLKKLAGDAMPLRLRLACALAYLGPEKSAEVAERLRFASAGQGATPSLLRRVAAGGETAVLKELGMKPLLGGADVMRLLGIGPGPEIGEALSLLMDAQAEGKVTDPQEAETYLKNR